MNILFLSAHLNAGGITSYLLTLTRKLTGRGHKVWVVSSGGDMVFRLESSGGSHVLLPVRFKFEFHPALLAQALPLVRLVRKEKIQVIHANTRATQVLAALVSCLTGVSYVSTCHGYFRAHIGRCLFPFWGKKVVAISRAVVEHLKKDHRVSSDKILRVPNGIEVDSFLPVTDDRREKSRQKWKIPADSFVVGMVARLSDVKGHRYLIEAMPDILKVFPTAKCLFFGEGPLERELKALVERLGVKDSVLFYPVVARSPEILPVFDVCVVPSLSEGLGLSAMEAMMTGIPVVASRVGGLTDIIEDGRTGWLVPAKDASQLALVLIKVLKDPKGRQRVAEAARELIKKDFSAEVMVAGTETVYKSL